MAKKTDRNLIVGLDIGTSKVAAVVSELTSNGDIEIIGIGVSPSRGLKKGVVVIWNQRYRRFGGQSKKLN